MTTFIYDGVRADNLDGVEARLTEWPSLGGLELETVDIPGAHGRFFGGASRSVLQFVFDVRVTGASPEQVYQRRDELVAVLNPSSGAGDLAIEGDSDWVTHDVVVAEEIAWERVIWRGASPLSLRGDVVLETVGRDPSARELNPHQVEFSSSTSFTLDRGNTSAFPSLLINGAGSPTTVTIGDFEVTLDPSTGWHLMLDWDRMRFYRTNGSGTVRYESVVGRMSNYDRPVLRPGETVQVSVSGSPDAVTLYPNARRI